MDIENGYIVRHFGLNTRDEVKSIRIGMVGHSLLRRYPLNQFPNFLNISLTIHVPRILEFYGKEMYKELLAQEPKLDAVFFYVRRQ